MPTLVPTPDHNEAADRLLGAWKQKRPVKAFGVSPAVYWALAQFIAEVLVPKQDVYLNRADIVQVLHGATGLGVGWAEMSGPGRVQRALAQVWHCL